MKLKLPPSVSSPQDLTALILEVKDYSRWFTHNAIKEQAHAKRGVAPPPVSPATLETVKTFTGKRLLDRPILDELVTALESFRKTAPTVTITLAAPPSAGVKTELVAWFRDNVAPDTLINFQFNGSLLGGMVVRAGSHVYDWSFRRQLLAARGSFPEVLRRV